MNSLGGQIPTFVAIRQRGEEIYKKACLYDDSHKKLAIAQE